MKLPFSFSLKFAFRLLLPGFIVTLGVFPIIHTILKQLDLTINSEFAFFLSVIIFGWMFVIFDMPIYMAFEGRRYWFNFLRKLFISFEESRLKNLEKQYQKFQNLDRTKYLEISVKLRCFPIDENGNFCAKFPTKIGNLIASYESYPKERYGIDSVFYWYRIWLKLDQDLREEIDNQQALADSTLYTVSALHICGILCLIYALLKVINIQFITVLPNARLLLMLAILAFLASYIIYTVSLHIHATFGEIYKSVFDNYKDKFPIKDVIEEISKITGETTINQLSKAEQYKIAWRYLHNYRIRKNGKSLKPNEINSQLNP